MTVHTRVLNTGLILFAFFLIFISSKKLYWNDQTLGSEKNSIGLITYPKNDIRLKDYSHHDWRSIENSNHVANGDRVFSNKNSEAKINLHNGNNITLNENSLIKIIDQNSINIKKGIIDIELSPKKTFNLIIGKKSIQIKSQKNSTIQIDHRDELNINVKKGSINIQSNKVELNFKENDIATLDSNLQIIKKHLPLYPINEIFQTRSNTLEVEFKTNQMDSTDPIEYSQSNNFDNHFTLNQSRKVNLKNGIYFWRIKGSSTFQTFKIIKVLSPPVDKTIKNIHIESYKDMISVNLFSARPAQNIQVQLQENKDILKEEFLKSDGSIVIENTGLRILKYRLRYSSEIEESAWSEEKTLTLKKLIYKKGSPQIIELTSPNQEVEFKWEKEKNSLSLFQLASDSQFQSLISSKRIRTKNFTKIIFPKTGKFFWRTFEINKNGEKIEQAPIELIIRPTPPPVKPTIEDIRIKINFHPIKKFFERLISNIFPKAYAAESEQIEHIIYFNKISNAKIYQVEIYTDKNLKFLLKKIETKNNFFSWKEINTGVYFWRLRIKDHWDRFSPYSDPSKLIIEKKISVKKTETTPDRLHDRDKQKKLSLSIGPSSLSYTFKDDKNYRIKGETINDIKIEYTFNSKIFSSQRELSIKYLTAGGKVFSDEEFIYRDLSLSTIVEAPLKFDIIGGVKEIPTYKESNNKAIYDGPNFLAYFGASLKKTVFHGKKYNFDAKFTYLPINVSEYELLLSYEYFYKENLFLMTDFSLNSSTANLSDTSYKHSSNQLLIGLKYIF